MQLACEVPAGQRALAAIEDAAQREFGGPLSIPLGSRAVDTAPEFLFLVPRGDPRHGWRSLADLGTSDPRGFALYVEAMLGGWAPPTHALDVFHFGNTPEMAAALAHLVVKGSKRGTAGWLAATEREGSMVPRAGQVSIVTDGHGHALCAIQTERVELLRFDQIDARHAWIEGEGDRSLEDWRAGHQRYFHAEAAQFGLTFTDDAMIFFEHFRVLAVFGRSDP